MSASYVHAVHMQVKDAERLASYEFGDRSMSHFFCRTCGVSPFSTVVSLPPDYDGAAKMGDSRINLGCVDDVDVFALEIQILDGRSF